MHEPPLPVQDKELLPWAKRLWEYLRESRVQAGTGLLLRRTRSGSIISLAPAGPEIVPSAPLHIIAQRPRYIAEPETPPAGAARRYYIAWGVLNDKLATNWDDHYDLTATTYFFAKPTLRTTDNLLITSWEIVTGAAVDTHVTADWVVGADRPATAAYLLGSVIVAGDVHSVVNSGGGSLLLSEHLTVIEPGTGAGDVEYGKQLTFHRQNY